MPNAEGTKIAEKAKERRENLKKGADAAEKAAKNLLAGKDPFSEEDIQAAILAQLPPEVQALVADAKSVKEAFDKLFPKDEDGERDFSVAGGIRTALDLLDRYGGEDVKKVLEARQKALDLAAKLGINIPSIEQLVNFNWDELSKTLKDLKFEDVVNLNNLISNLEGKLLEFLPPGMDKSIAALRDMLKEFGLPSSLSEAYDQLTKKVDVKPIEHGDQNVYQPGVFVNKHRMARMGLTFMAHGAVPLTGGPGAATVKIENMPVWRSKVDFHTCPVPFAAPPAPDGPGMCSGGSKDVKVEGSFACQHDIEGIDTPLCGKTNLFLTQGQAISAWNKLKSQGGKLEDQDTEKAAAGGGKNKGGGGGGEGTEKDGPPEKKEGELVGVTAHFKLITTGAIKDGQELSFQCLSFDPDTGGSAESPNPDSIVAREWRLEGGALPSLSNKNEQVFTTTFRMYFEDGEPKKTFTVTLNVRDAQGHTGSSTQTFSADNPEKPKAVIKRLPTISQPGKIPVMHFRCESYSPVEGGPEATPLKITQRDWKINGTSVGAKLEYDHGDGFNREVRVDPANLLGSGASAEDLSLTLTVTNDAGETDTTSIDFAIDIKPIARIGKKEFPDQADLYVKRHIVGHKIVLHSASYIEGFEPLVGITRHRWTVVAPGGQEEREGKSLELTLSQVGWHEIYLEAFSGEQQSDQRDFYKFAVNPPLTWENVEAYLESEFLSIWEEVKTKCVSSALLKAEKMSIEAILRSYALDYLRKSRAISKNGPMGPHEIEEIRAILKPTLKEKVKELVLDIVNMALDCMVAGVIEMMERTLVSSGADQEWVETGLSWLKNLSKAAAYVAKVKKRLAKMIEAQIFDRLTGWSDKAVGVAIEQVILILMKEGL